MKVFTRVSVAIASALLFVFSSSAVLYAVPLALEDFEAPGVSPGSLNGQGNAGDWAGLWTGLSSGQTIKDVSADPLIVTLPDGTVIDGGDQAVSVTGNANNLAARQFGTPIDDEVYIGFLMRFEAGVITDNDFVTLCFNDLPECTFSTIPTVGLKANLGSGGTDIMVRNSSTESEYSSKQVVIGETIYIVARVYKTGGPADNFDRIDLWVNPDLSDPTTEANPDATADDTSTIADVDYIALRGATLGPSDEVLVDGFQLATEWDDVFTPPPATVRMSEVAYDSTQTGNDINHEWIELYNYGEEAVNISGWSLEDSTGNTTGLPAGSIIPANNYYLLANDTTGFNTNYPAITPDQDLSPELELGDIGDSLTLNDTKNEAIDFVAWENNVLSWNLTAGVDAGDTLCRVDPEIDTNSVSDWRVCTITTPKSPNNTNTAPTDILLDGSATDSVQENTPINTTISSLSSADINTGDSHTYTLVAGTGSEDNGRFTIDGSSLNLAFTPDFESPVDTGDAVGDNTYSIRVRSDDSNDGIYEKIVIISVTDVDDTAPATPTLLDLLSASDSGSSQTDNLTNDLQPSFVVNCSESGSTITLYSGVTIVGSVVCLAAGQTTVTPSSALTNGSHIITYTETDSSNNTSTASSGLSIIIDSTPPVMLLNGSSPTVLNQGGDYIQLGSTSIDARDGAITAIITSGTVDTTIAGTYTVTYTSVDTAGNTTSIARTVTVLPVAGYDGDGDGVDDSGELAGPNGGDVNGDGISDATQSSVASLPNPLNDNKYFALESVSTLCSIVNGVNINEESAQTSQSDLYEFPKGLFDFTISCSSIGESTTLIFYLDEIYDTTDWIFVKYDRLSGQYQQFNERVSYSVAAVGSRQVTTMSYVVTDGQFLDEDGVANGEIVDPAGPAVLAVTAEEQKLEQTGYSLWVTMFVSATLVSMTSYAAARSKKVHV